MLTSYTLFKLPSLFYNITVTIMLTAEHNRTEKTSRQGREEIPPQLRNGYGKEVRIQTGPSPNASSIEKMKK